MLLEINIALTNLIWRRPREVTDSSRLAADRFRSLSGSGDHILEQGKHFPSNAKFTETNCIIATLRVCVSV